MTRSGKSKKGKGGGGGGRKEYVTLVVKGEKIMPPLPESNRFQGAW